MADASTTTGRTAATESASSGDEMNAYVGSLISLMSRSDIRYEGFLYTLNAHDSTIGLSHVRSFGTEGRKKDGPQLPTGDKVYEYILFRGSDIKDLQVKLPPRAKLGVGVHDDTSIIMSQHTTGNSLSQSVKSGGVLMCSNFNHYQPYPRESHEHQSSSQLGLSGHISTGLFSGLPTGDWKEHNGTEVRISPQSQLYSSLYQNTLQSWSETSQVHESSNIGLAKASEYSNFAPQLPPVFLNSTLPPHNICVTDNVPTLVSPASPCQDTNTIVSPIPSVSFASTPVILLPFGSTSFPDSLLIPPLVPPSTFTPQDYSVHNMKPLVPDMHNLYVDQLNLGVMASTSSGYCPQNVPTQSLTATSMQQSQYCGPIFTEEFDFEAMNEKFKKEDLWGYLGRVKGRDTAADQNMSGRDGLGIKPAYKKDEFFDTISSSLNRGMGNRRNKYQNHPEMNNEWQNGNHESYEAPYGGTSRNWGRGYDEYDGRGYGRNTPFDSN